MFVTKGDKTVARMVFAHFYRHKLAAKLTIIVK